MTAPAADFPPFPASSPLRRPRSVSTASAPETSAPAGPAPAAPLSIRVGPPEAFAAIRALFVRAAFDDPTVARRLGGPHLFGFPRLVDGRKTLDGAVEDANAALIRLLLDGEPLAEAHAVALCGAEGIDALRAVGVLVPDAADPAALRATVLLSPVHDVWLASDRPPVGRRLDPHAVPRDFVFPALSDLTREFLEVIAPAPGARVLELCAGSGVAALLAARHGAAEAWATDVTARSVHFARFNAALNGLDAVTAVESDVWAALAGETFDRVYAHPPYVPALAHVFDFRDAGADGEQITRRIVEGLAEHLRPGGRCAITCALTDRRDAPVERRIRAWLGDAAPEFDLVVLQRRDWDAMHAYKNVANGGAGFVDAERWLRHFEGLGIERFLLCSFELRREAAGRAPVTERRRVGKRIDHAAMDWHFAWARHFADAPTPEARLAGQAPRVVPGARVNVSLRADDDGSWETTGATVETDYPTVAAVQAPPLAPTLLELCDGTRDVPALLAALREAGLVGDDVTAGEVAALVELMLTAGALEIAPCPVPRRQAATTATSSVPTQSTSA